jgi:hypothetical protein
MRSHERRREFLQLSGVAVAAGLAGCVFGSGSNTTTSGGRSYDAEFTNDITSEDMSENFESHGTAVSMSLEVDRVIDGENEVLFEETVEAGFGESRTFEDAFSTEKGETYGVNARLDQPYVSIPAGGQHNLRAGYTFEGGGENAPSNGRVTVTTVDTEDGSLVLPEVVLGERPPSR